MAEPLWRVSFEVDRIKGGCGSGYLLMRNYSEPTSVDVLKEINKVGHIELDTNYGRQLCTAQNVANVFDVSVEEV